MMKQVRSVCFALAVSIAAPFCAGGAVAAPKELSDTELSAVSGQGLATLTNSSGNGLNFSTLTFNADVTLNANFHNVVLGQYNIPSNNGTGSDINIPLMQFGRSDGTTAQQTVQITNPYVEFVYNNSTGANTGQVIGMRLGFQGISGDVGLNMSSVSGSLQVANSTGGLLSSLGSRSGTACVATTSCIPLSQIGGVTAGNASGPSRDFWISMLSQSVQFPAQDGMTAPAVAQAGAWLNWTDRLTALNTSGLIPPNVAQAMLTQAMLKH
jgi:hypothetical protein